MGTLDNSLPACLVLPAVYAGQASNGVPPGVCVSNNNAFLPWMQDEPFMDTIDPEVRADVEYGARLLAKAIARRQAADQVGLAWAGRGAWLHRRHGGATSWLGLLLSTPAWR